MASALAERVNVVFMNSVVTRGRAEVVVSATGRQTEMGRIAGMLEATTQAPTPLQVQLDHLAKRLALVALVVVAVISAFELLRGDSLAQMAIEAVTLAVAAVPEGLPAVVTVTLALGLHRMARHRAIVKQHGGGRDAGLYDRHLLRQDRHADDEPDDGASVLVRRASGSTFRARDTAPRERSESKRLKKWRPTSSNSCSPSHSATTARFATGCWSATPRRGLSSLSRPRHNSTWIACARSFRASPRFLSSPSGGSWQRFTAERQRLASS